MINKQPQLIIYPSRTLFSCRKMNFLPMTDHARSIINRIISRGFINVVINNMNVYQSTKPSGNINNNFTRRFSQNITNKEINNEINKNLTL